MRGPCLGCEKRHIGCHGECAIYRAFSTERQAEAASRRDIVNDYKRESFVRCSKKKTKVIKRMNDEQKG